MENGEILYTPDRLYSLAPDCACFSVNFAASQPSPRLLLSRVIDPWSDDPAPEADGIFQLDLTSGASKLTVSLAQLAGMNPVESMGSAFHYVNHIQVSPGSKRFAFFHIWRTGETTWQVRLYSAKLDGSGLNCLLDSGKISHYDWMDDANILVWARQRDVGERFLLCNLDSGSRRIIGEGLLTEDGHCSFSPDRQWVLNDTYPDPYDMRTLMLFRWRDCKRIDLARLHSPKSKWWGEIRCDRPPRWSPDGTRSASTRCTTVPARCIRRRDEMGQRAGP